MNARSANARSARLLPVGSVLLLLTILATPAAYGARESEHEDGFTVLWQREGLAFEVFSRGDVELTADESAIRRLEPDGIIRIRVTDSRQVRHLEVTPGAAGSPEYRYRVGGEVRPFDVAGQAWLAGLLPELVSETGLGAGSRVERLRLQGGTEAVLDEVARLAKPRIQRLVLGHLLDAGIATSDLIDVVRCAARELPADGDLATFLVSASPYYLDSPEPRAAFLEAAAVVGNEDQRARLAVALLKGPAALSIEAREEVIRSTLTHLDSDATRTNFLAGIADEALAEEALHPAFLDGLASIQWEDGVARLAAALLTREELASDLRHTLFSAAFERLESDNTRTSLLTRIAAPFLEDPQLRPAYLQAAATVHDDWPRAVLKQTLREYGVR